MEEKDLALYEAIRTQNIQQVNNAIKAGANVNAFIFNKNDANNTIEYKWEYICAPMLTYALNCQPPQSEIIKLLIDNGAQIDDSYTEYSLILLSQLADKSKFPHILCRLTVIERVANQGNLEIIKYMVDKGANPTCYSSITYSEDIYVDNTSNKTYTIPDGGEELEQYQEIEEKIRKCRSNTSIKYYKDIMKIALEYPQYMVCLAEKRVSLEKRNKNILEYLDQATVLYNSQIRGKDINHILDSIENNNIMDFQEKLPLVLDKTTLSKEKVLNGFIKYAHLCNPEGFKEKGSIDEYLVRYKADLLYDDLYTKELINDLFIEQHSSKTKSKD